jgi:hypothetical protein
MLLLVKKIIKIKQKIFNMANRAIKDNNLTLNDDTKKYKAYAMEESRLKKAKELCEISKDCSEYQRLGGENRLREVEGLVHQEQKKDDLRRKTQTNTNPNNMYQNELNPTNVSTAKVTKSSEHNKNGSILSNSDYLKEEISSIKYLIEYMNTNNNNNKLNL